MMEFDVDMGELEQQRYNEIKKKGKYLELDILIDADDTDENEMTHSKIPVVTTCMHGSGPEEIACLYATLKALIDHYETEYPVECFLSKIGLKLNHLGSTETPVKHDDEEE